MKLFLPSLFTFLAIVLLLPGIQAFTPAMACTLFAAAGSAVEGGGTLLAKNRDWVPNQRHQLVILSPEGGHRGVALEAVGGADSGVKAGVNEQGLAIVSATAGQVPTSERAKLQQTRQLMRRILSSCATVDNVLAGIELFRRPAFYLIADRREVALIEVSPEGRPVVSRRQNDTLAHTNHYVALDTPPNVIGPRTSSLRRYERIGELLKARSRPFTLDDFIVFSSDRAEGPDNSIWRTGRKEGKTRTLATCVFAIPAAGSPHLYVKTADPGEPDRTCRLSVEEALGRRNHLRVSRGEGVGGSSDLRARHRATWAVSRSLK